MRVYNYKVERERLMKICIECHKNKPLVEYNYTYPRGRGEKGFPRQRCKPCQNTRQRKLRADRFKEDPQKRVIYLANKRERRMAQYDLTQVEYLAKVQEQKGLCYICQRPHKLYVDHNHNTGEVRKLLCNRCNRALGYIGEDINVLNNMIKYLEEH